MKRTKKWLALSASLASTCLATTVVCDVPNVGAIVDYVTPGYVIVEDDCCYYDDYCCGGFWFDGWWW